jgi:hypothetical protein
MRLLHGLGTWKMQTHKSVGGKISKEDAVSGRQCIDCRITLKFN